MGFAGSESPCCAGIGSVRFDGFRLEAVKKNGAATLYSRRWKASLPNTPTVAKNPASAQAYGQKYR